MKATPVFRATPMPFPMDGGGGGTTLNARGPNAGNRLSPVAALPAWFTQQLKTVGNTPSQPQAPQSAPAPPQASSSSSSGEVALEMSPRGKHKYPPDRPWSCHHIAAWTALIGVFFTLTLVIIFQLSGKHPHHTDLDFDRRGDASLGTAAEAPHENYVAFRFEAETSATRWPKTGVIAGLNLEDIVAARLCCVVGTQQYLVCDSSQALTSNLGIAFVVRNLPEENGAHLLITAPSTDMSGSQCLFSWQTRIHQHDKAALVIAKGAPVPPAASARWSHADPGRRKR